MVNPQPVSKAVDALISLAKRIEAADELDQVSLARFDKAARESIRQDPVYAYQVLGITAGQRWDVDGVDRNFANAVSAGGGAEGNANWGRALADLNDPVGAAAQLEQASAKMPQNLTYLRAAARYNFCAGQWEDFDRLFAQLISRVAEVDPDTQRLRDIVDMARRIGIIEKTVRASVTSAFNFLRTKKLRVVSYAHGMNQTQGDECIYFGIQIRALPSAASQIDSEFTPILFASVTDPQLESFVLSIEAA